MGMTQEQLEAADDEGRAIADAPTAEDILAAQRLLESVPKQEEALPPEKKLVDVDPVVEAHQHDLAIANAVVATSERLRAAIEVAKGRGMSVELSMSTAQVDLVIAGIGRVNVTWPVIGNVTISRPGPPAPLPDAVPE